MTVNITLLIQVIQFFIAYYFLRTFVFIPGLRLLEKKKKQRVQLQQAINQEQVKVELAYREKQSESFALRNTLLNSMPGVDVQPNIPSHHYINDLTMYDQGLEEKEKQALQQVIIKHLSHDE